VRALGAHTPAPSRILDLGCGTGIAGAAWALAAGGTPYVSGVDRSGWAVEESRWTLARLSVKGEARKADLSSAAFPSPPGAVVAAFTANELTDPERERLGRRLLDAAGEGTGLLVVEPLARGVAPWWPAWRAAVREAGGREDEWRFAVTLPPPVALLAKAAGLDPRHLTGRSLFVPVRPRGHPARVS
jgi:SAM-dependent methyltransferase